MPEEKLPRVFVGEVEVFLGKDRLYVFFRFIEFHGFGPLRREILSSVGALIQRGSRYAPDRKL
jgi:hypothetical protein